MKFALRADQRIEATPNALGVCPCCGTEMIAKCGNRKVWHWAHKTKQTCDHWWENETQWHRDWKNRFPVEWKEVIHKSDDGEKHIADVKTPDGLVIEFQHSAIKPEEQQSREQFYKKMIWLVDGTRLKTDRARFGAFASLNAFYYQRIPLHWVDELFPPKWLDRLVTVYFDTGNPNYLICLPRQYYSPTFYLVPRTMFTEEFSDLLCKYGDDFFVERSGDYFINLMEEKSKEAISNAQDEGVFYEQLAYKVRSNRGRSLEKLGLSNNEIAVFKKIRSIQDALQHAKNNKSHRHSYY